MHTEPQAILQEYKLHHLHVREQQEERKKKKDAKQEKEGAKSEKNTFDDWGKHVPIEAIMKFICFFGRRETKYINNK